MTIPGKGILMKLGQMKMNTPSKQKKRLALGLYGLRKGSSAAPIVPKERSQKFWGGREPAGRKGGYKGKRSRRG